MTPTAYTTFVERVAQPVDDTKPRPPNYADGDLVAIAITVDHNVMRGSGVAVAPLADVAPGTAHRSLNSALYRRCPGDDPITTSAVSEPALLFVRPVLSDG